MYAIRSYYEVIGQQLMADRPEFVLIDGHAVAYRQFFALKSPNFVTRDGEATNAVYGFTRILLDILQNEKPQYIAVTFDMGLSRITSYNVCYTKLLRIAGFS